MISKSQIKLITSLHQKKYRNKTGLFIAEGPKIIGDLLDSGLPLHSIYATDGAEDIGREVEVISASNLNKISALKTANTMLAVFHMPRETPIDENGLLLALDDVRDPGNLGTIIRLCDWFGVKHVICSAHTADCFNPKVVQATMGSIARVQLHYTDLSAYLKNTRLPVYTAVMEGPNVYDSSLAGSAILVMGNEANGVSSEIEALANTQITIPHFGDSAGAESLNVATATAILLSEFRRKGLS